MSAGLAEVLAEHVMADVGMCQCFTTDVPIADRCDECRPLITEVAAAVTEWLGERLRGAREDVAVAAEAAVAESNYLGDPAEADLVADAALGVVSAALEVEVGSGSTEDVGGAQIAGSEHAMVVAARNLRQAARDLEDRP